MTINQIIIDIEDNRKYGLIALLVDRDDFLTDIADVRSSIKNLVIPYTFPQLNLPEADYIVNAYNNNAFTINEACMALEEIGKEKGLHLVQIEKVLGSAVVFAESLLKKYNKSRLYFPVILATILVGKVTTYDFNSTYMLELDSDTVQNELQNIDTKGKLTAIIVNRESTLSEVEKTFEFMRKYTFGTKKLKKDDGLGEAYKDRIPSDKLQDTIQTIQNVRQWYWWHKVERIGAKKIWDRLQKQNIRISIKGVEQALSRYKKNLQKPL